MTIKESHIKLLELQKQNNLFYFLFGLGVLVLNKIRYFFMGYTSPKPFDISQTQRAVDYDVNVIKHWLHQLNLYTGEPVNIKGKNILELGPGSDFGIGLLILAMGARQYNALDVNNLVENVPPEFYETLFGVISCNTTLFETKEEVLRRQLEKTKQGNNERLNYVCKNDFDVRIFGKESIDIVFSQAAIEHFDDIGRTFSQLSEVVRPGGFLVAEIDLGTHTRWLRDVDPLNIYRYPGWLYKGLMFRGVPNRVRPDEYRYALESSGWTNIRISPLVVLSDSYYDGIWRHLAKQFRGDKADMKQVAIMVCATKNGLSSVSRVNGET